MRSWHLYVGEAPVGLETGTHFLPPKYENGVCETDLTCHRAASQSCRMELETRKILGAQILEWGLSGRSVANTVIIQEDVTSASSPCSSKVFEKVVYKQGYWTLKQLKGNRDWGMGHLKHFYAEFCNRNSFQLYLSHNCFRTTPGKH